MDYRKLGVRVRQQRELNRLTQSQLARKVGVTGRSMENIMQVATHLGYMDIPEDAWLAAIDAVVPEKFREMNKKAFALGRNA